jgi:nitroreductase
MMKRRSVRVFKDWEFESIIEELVDVANQAPTGVKYSTLSIILVQTSEGRKMPNFRGQPW